MNSWGQADVPELPEPPSPPRRRIAPAKVLPWVVAALLAVLLLYVTFGAGQPRLTPSDVDREVAKVMASATPPPSDASLVYQAVRPSVVAIESQGLPEGGDTGEGSGTGVIVDESGTILTALHVVQGAQRITVIFADGSESDAKITGQQPENDIAVLTPSQPPDLIVPAILGDPTTLHPGDEAIVIGNPLGLVGSLTSGVISGLGRSFKRPDNGNTIQNLIQFDAAVNPGNSGGPLLDRNGEVVGIVTALANPTKEKVFIGIGFAVPIQTASNALGSSPY